MTTATKAEFLAAYQAALMDGYWWARDPERRARFMASVKATLAGPGASWIHGTPTVAAVWRSLGLKGRPTLKALRELPDAPAGGGA